MDLLKLAQASKTKQNRGDNNRGGGEAFKLIIDGECCLDRLYGGYFPDWLDS